MDKDIIHKGGCGCGAVRFEAHGEPTRTVVCHCRYCQTRTGSAFGANVYFADEKVQFSGEMKTYVFTNNADRSFTNWFCPTCPTTVAWAVELRPGWTGIAMGAFDPPTFWATPDAEIFCRSRAPFIETTIADQDETSGYYDPKHAERDGLQLD